MTAILPEIGSIDAGLRHSILFLGYGRLQFVKPGEEQLENRRSVSLVVADDEVDRRRIPGQRTTGHRPREEIPRISGHEHHGAGRGDQPLHRIADALQALQKLNFYQLTASFRKTGQYSHAYAMMFDVDRDSPAGQAIAGCTEDDLVTALRDLANWLYRTLEREHKFLTSDENVDEGMSANGYTFTAEGRRFG